MKFILLIFTPSKSPTPSISLEKNEWVALVIFASLCLFLGTAGKPISQYVLHQTLEISVTTHLLKWPSYLLNYAFCFGVYHFYIKKSVLFKRLRTVELSFNSINIAIVTFFFFTLTYLNAQ
ncbi:MAG TPA: hypothetical protein DCS67_00335 [Clostridiales bacterium UBA8960]|nr:hypothetical protein [Clostridiales bacterium UBA8960]